jgi:hypothetical protein
MEGTIQYRKLIEQESPAVYPLQVEVTDEPGAGGAQHRYEITGFDNFTNPSYNMGTIAGFNRTVILFQNGPIPEAGVNGVTHEVLLAIIADRLRSFQAGKFACGENEDALYFVERAMKALKSRTTRRMDQGIEGTHTVDKDITGGVAG